MLAEGAPRGVLPCARHLLREAHGRAGALLGCQLEAELRLVPRHRSGPPDRFPPVPLGEDGAEGVGDVGPEGELGGVDPPVGVGGESLANLAAKGRVTASPYSASAASATSR